MSCRCKTITGSPPKTHIGDIMRPSTERGSQGQKVGEPTVIARGVRYSFKSLAGRELESARQVFALATCRVILHLNRSWGLTPKDYIVPRTGPNAGKPLDIGHIMDEELLGLDTPLLCRYGDLS